MIIQRNTPVKVYGWSSSYEAVRIQLGQFSSSVLPAGSEYFWEVILPPCPAGGPHDLRISSESDRIVIQDIYFGDVWLCSGQSNMLTPLSRLQYDYPHEVEAANNQLVRIFMVPESAAFGEEQQDLPGGSWIPVSPEQAGNLSAVSWFFAHEMQRKTGIPQGVINASVGGTPIQSWMSAASLQEYPEYLQEASYFADTGNCSRITSDAQNEHDRWFGELNAEDPGVNSIEPWMDGSYILREGYPMQIPFADTEGSILKGCGSFWFARAFELPAESEEPAGDTALLRLGRMVDSDTVWVNGILVGTTDYQYPPRNYELPENVLKPGQNVVVVRLVSGGPPAGFIPDKPYYLETGSSRIGLEGEWLWLRGKEMQPLTEFPRFVSKPVGLYNAMISPLSETALSGVVWYQGESNVEDNPGIYYDLLVSLIHDWRVRMCQPELPFVLVQLPSYGIPMNYPQLSGWATVRDAQRRAHMDIDHTALTVTIDLGEWNDIHPLNKIDVGRRIASAALTLLNQDSTEGVSPVPELAVCDSHILYVDFRNCPDGLKTSDGRLPGHLFVSYSLDEDDWQAVSGTISGSRLEISLAADWGCPHRLCYAWADNPEGVNICSSEGLPVSPFQMKVRQEGQ
ncbi:sialate O-acetylesterase [Spirochaeta dissipatitropha]